MREKITASELSMLVFSLSVSTSLMLLPTTIIPIVKQDAWWIILIGTFVSVCVNYVYYLLWEKFPKWTMYEVSRHLFGKLGGSLIGMVLLFFYLYINAIVLWEIQDVIVAAFLPETPPYAILILRNWMKGAPFQVIPVEIGFPIVLLVAAVLRKKTDRETC